MQAIIKAKKQLESATFEFELAVAAFEAGLLPYTSVLERHHAMLDSHLCWSTSILRHAVQSETK